MNNKNVFFFAEFDDLKPILTPIESIENIKYYEAGVFDFPDVPCYSTYSLIPNLGQVNSGDWNHCKFYAICPKSNPINKRLIPLKKGGVRYAIYQDNNPRSVILKAGGVFRDGILVAGSIGTISQDAFSMALFNSYAKLIKKNFSKIGTFYVGPNAKLKLQSGWRLVTNEKSPKEYDLKL